MSKTSKCNFDGDWSVSEVCNSIKDGILEAKRVVIYAPRYKGISMELE